VKQLALTAIALLLGALATFFAAQSMGLLGPSAASSEVMLVVAAAPIAAGQVIESGQVKTMAWPRGKAPEQSFLKASAVVGRVAKHPIYPGELLLEPKLAAVDARGGLASTIESGKRAISVGVNEVVGVTGFALPGSYVDVLVSAKDAANAPFATTVLTRIKVLAVAQDTETDVTKPKVVKAVTLELTPSEAEKLDLARSIGTLSLVLRNENDTAVTGSDGTRLSDILRSAPPEPVRVAPSPAPAPAAAQARAKPPAAPRPARAPSDETDTVTSIRGIAKREEQP
jgi:pilus assembly protein CpaB